MSELRWNPLLGEWVATATHRQDRTFLPPANFCPLCPTAPGGFPTEIPAENYDIVVFENRFPSLSPDPPEPAVENSEFYPVRPARGECEVIVYSPDHNTTLAREPAEKIFKLVQVWIDRFRELSARDYVKYVFIFENKGKETGVTLHHPHGQIYAYPFIPPLIQKELNESKKHFEKTGSCLLCDILKEEKNDGRRMITENDGFAAYIPFFARYPYEVHISAKRHLRNVGELNEKEQAELAEILKQVTAAYNKIFDVEFPYIMVLHQQPSDGENYDHYHFHIEFYPPLRAATKLKYLAGSEAGAGMFINDTLAEEKAAELRGHIEKVEWKA
jgi:UDPglucose--hexose-1-phosphate uridylyltransferase